MQDRYLWAVKLTDNSVVYQRRTDPNTGKEEINSYEDIDKSRVRIFSLLDTHNEMRPMVRLYFDNDGDKLIWTRRVQIVPGEGHTTYHIVGKKGRYVMAVSPRGEVLVMNNFSEDDVLFSPIIENKRTNEESTNE